MTLGLIFVFAQSVFGQQAPVSKKLTLQDCVRIALNRNTTVLQAKYQSESQSARVLSAYGALLPSISASGNFTYSYSVSPGVQVFQGIVIPGSQTTYNRRYQAGVGANYTLFDGTANIASLNEAKSQSKSSGLSYTRAKQTAVYQTTQDYLLVFNSRDQLRISEDNLKRDQRQLEQIKESNAVGSSSLADVYNQQAIVSSDEYSLVQAQNTYEQNQANLKYYLGIPVTDSVEFVDPAISTSIDTTQFAGENARYQRIAALMNRAFESRPDYEAAIASVNASKSALAVAEAAYSPTISANAQYGINGPGLIGGQISQNKSFYAGLSISLPIFNGFQTQTNIQVADISLKTAQQNLDATKRQVQLDVYKALLNLYSSEKGYLSAVRAVAYAKINLETAQEKYRVGSGTLLDVLTANALYTQDLSSRVVAAYTYIQAKQQVEYAIGTINY